MEEMKEYVLKRNGKRPVAFTGKLLASVATHPDRAHPDYSGDFGIWHKAAVYKTNTGLYVLEYVIYSRWQGADDYYRVYVENNLDAIVNIIEEDLATRVSNMLLDKLKDVENIAERL